MTYWYIEIYIYFTARGFWHFSFMTLAKKKVIPRSLSTFIGASIVNTFSSFLNFFFHFFSVTPHAVWFSDIEFKEDFIFVPYY